MREKLSIVLELFLFIAVSAEEKSQIVKGPWSFFNEPEVLNGQREIDRSFKSSDFVFAGPQNLAKNSQQKSLYVDNFAPKFYDNPLPPKKVFSPSQFNTGPQTFQPNYIKLNPGIRHQKPAYAPNYPQAYGKSLFFGPQSKRPPNLGTYIVNKQRPNIGPHPPPVLNNYKVYHPYQEANPNLNQYHKDPGYIRIKDAVNQNGQRLKQKEEPTLHDEDYKSSRKPDEEAEIKFNKNEQNENFQPKYEPHRHQNAPHYYSKPHKVPINYGRINQKNRYPRPNHPHIKVSPQAYIPLRNHISNLRANQGKTFSDENSDYPAVKPPNHDEDEKESDGHDIFDRQKEKYEEGQGNFETTFDNFNHRHHPKSIVNHNYNENDFDNKKVNDDDDFVPIRMYAQVRHTETTKHLPREQALKDAETYDEFLNAPRLKQAIKTSKAQTVYSEEGYEDNAYDHAGHLKHASNHEGHGGFVKSKNQAAGKYKEGEAEKYEDGGRTAHGEGINTGKKWLVDKEHEEDTENHESFENKEGGHESHHHDQAEAGSEKRGYKKLVNAPNSLKFKANVNKLLMTSDEEQTKVEDTNDGVMVNTKSMHVSMNNDPEGATTRPKYIRLRPKYYWKRKKNNDIRDKDYVPKADSSPSKNKTDIKADIALIKSRLFSKPEYSMSKVKSEIKSESFVEKIPVDSKLETSPQKNKTDFIKLAILEKNPNIHRRVRRDDNFQVPTLGFDDVFLTGQDLKSISKEKLPPKKADYTQQKKYPYYNIFKNSPLQYAENFSNIPSKTKGGSEFYDSRSSVVCSEVEPHLDPVPDRIKNKQPHDDDDNDDDEEEDDGEDRKKRHIKTKTLKRRKRDNFDENKQPRLKGLGDNIDCFKEKYFGTEPLDSPFFSEDVIEPPEPINTPFKIPHSLPIVNLVPFGSVHREKVAVLKNPKHQTTKLSVSPNPIFKKSYHNNKDAEVTTYKPAYKLYHNQNLPELLTGERQPIRRIPGTYTPIQPKIIAIPNDIIKKYTLSRDPQMKVYGDVIGNIRANLNAEYKSKVPVVFTPSYIPINYGSKPNGAAEFRKLPKMVYYAYKNKDDIKNPNRHVRITRNNHFVYEPYKIIKENQSQTKRPPSANNLRPKLKKKKRIHFMAQASTNFETTVDINGQPVKRNINSKVYKDIGKRDRKAADDLEPIAESETTTISDAPIFLSEKVEEDDDDDSDNKESYDERRGEPRYENGEEAYHKNHKKFYSPVTSKSSISPEELKVEYILKSKEDTNDSVDETTLANENNTPKDDSENKTDKPEDIEEETVTQQVSLDGVHRFQKPTDANLRFSPTIFDVTAFLPRPIYLTTYLPRHNLSSKYTSDAEKVSSETDKILAIPLNIQNESQLRAASATEIIPRTTSRVDRTRQRVEVSTRPQQSSSLRNNLRRAQTFTTTENIVNLRRKTDDALIDSEIKTTSVQPRKIRKRNRIKIVTTTVAPVLEPTYYYEQEIPTTRRSIRTRVLTEKSTQPSQERPIYETISTEQSFNRDAEKEDDLGDKNTEYEETHKVFDTDDSDKLNESRDSQDDEDKTEENYYDSTTSREDINLNEQNDYTSKSSNDKSNNDEAYSATVSTIHLEEKQTPPQVTQASRTPSYDTPFRTRTRGQSLRAQPQFERRNSNSNNDYEVVSHKPRILEKTSKKRKTTVITNSKLYNNPIPEQNSRKTNHFRTSQPSRRRVEPVTKRTIISKSDYDDDIERLDVDADDDHVKSTKRSEELRHSPINEESKFEEDVEEEEVIQETENPSTYSNKNFEFTPDPDLPKQINRLSEVKKEDQHPVHSDVEVFRADFKMNRGPKHGGNYKKIPTVGKIRKRLDEAGELDDLNVGSGSDASLHGGNYRTERDDKSEAVADRGISAHVLNSFASFLPTANTTDEPAYEKNPGKRLYFFANI